VEVAICRVVTAKSIRGHGIGITLMEKSLECIKAEYGDVPVRLSAQTYLLNYYEKYGFASTGKEYFEHADTTY
jgi:ElaA protein